MNSTRRFITACAAVGTLALGLAIATTPARAADSDVAVSQLPIHFGDLDVDTPQGAKILYMRLNGAANLVCGESPDLADLAAMREMQRCQQKAIEKAVAQVNRPQLTALYDSHFPREPLTDAVRATLASTTTPTVTAR